MTPSREIAIADGQQWLFIEEQVPPVIGRLFEFPHHSQHVARTGLHAYAGEQPVARQRTDLKRNKSELP